MASKRRAQLYTLPIVVGVAFLIVAGLAAWRRADLIATLSDQIAHGDKSQAAKAISQLVVISNPPFPILIEAAACDDRAIVEAAEVAINKLLDEWQLEVDNHQRLSRVAEQVSSLSAALAEKRRMFPTSSYTWLASVTHKMVRIADECPPKKTALLALHCDEIMTLIGNASVAAASAAPYSTIAAMPKQSSVATAGAGINASADRLQLEHTFTAFPTAPTQFGPTPLRPIHPGDAVVDEDGRAQNSDNPLRHEITPPAQNGSGTPQTSDLDSTTVASPPSDRSDDATHGNRIPLTLDISRSISAVTPEVHTPSASGTYSTRELLERWRTAGGDEHRDIENQLAARGFKHLSPALVQQYLSSDDNRSHIVDAVLRLPGAEVRPWLFLLADDEDADVRLMAVTVMATSADRALIEKAWQISIRDEDPRIADLSAHLRERRAGTQLR